MKNIPKILSNFPSNSLFFSGLAILFYNIYTKSSLSGSIMDFVFETISPIVISIVCLLIAFLSRNLDIRKFFDKNISGTEGMALIFSTLIAIIVLIGIAVYLLVSFLFFIAYL
ncbi:MAG: hypothetical protein WCX30_03885 [Candidatus Paceibacterota bacterium]|jgi:hypothetical protein